MRRFLKDIMVLWLIVFMAVFSVAPNVYAAYSVKQVFVRVSGTAGETVTTGQLVCIKDADGEWYKADANDSDLRPAVGIVGSKTGGDGETIEVIISGIVKGWSSLSEGQPGYLSETAGAITQSAPTWIQQAGIALDTETYFMDFNNYFDSSSLTTLGTLAGMSPLMLEGTTADIYETTIIVTDPTADNELTLPDDSGAFVYSPGGGTTSDADSLAIPITHAYVAKTTGADAEALTLANGENGQILTIDLATDGGGAGTLSPTTCSGFTSIVFADAGDNATLMYVNDTVGWIILGTAGVAAPPATVD